MTALANQTIAGVKEPDLGKFLDAPFAGAIRKATYPGQPFYADLLAIPRVKPFRTKSEKGTRLAPETLSQYQPRTASNCQGVRGLWDHHQSTKPQ